MLVLEHPSTNPSFVVRYYGKALAATNNCQLDQGIMFGKQSDYSACLMVSCYPNNRFKCLPHGGNNSFAHCDAVVLTESKQSVAFATNDCGAMILSDKNTGNVILVHPGRNQLMDYAHPHIRRTIIEAAVTTLLNNGADAGSIEALIFGQIKPENFAHEYHLHKDLILAQANVWGTEIVTDRESVTLNLNRLIEKQLKFYGVSRKPKTLGQFDPYTCPDLFSKRAGKAGSNLVVLQLK